MFLLRLNLIEVAIQSSANMSTPTTVGCTDFLLQTGLTLPPICPSRAPYGSSVLFTPICTGAEP